MCDIVRDIFIGLASGILSSWIVSACLKNKWDKQQHIIDFQNDKQEYCRYLQRIRNELLIGHKTDDYDYVIRSIDSEPQRKTFSNLTQDNKNELQDIQHYLQELRDELYSKKISLSRYKDINGKLFQYTVHVLKFEEQGKSSRKPHD